MTVNRNVAVKALPPSFFALSLITVLLRCYVRMRVTRAFGWDDGMMIIALIFYGMFCGCMVTGGVYGTGMHFDQLTTSHRVKAMMFWWLCEIGYCVSSIFCKCSICIFLARITVKRPHLVFLYIIMTLTVLMGLVLMFGLLFQCRPVTYFWTRVAFDPTIQGTCVITEVVEALTYAYSAVAAVCDLAVGIVPFFIIWGLNMPFRRKVAAVAICSISCIACSAVIIRFPFVRTFADMDFLYKTYEIAVWSNVEVGLGIFAGSLATLHPLLRHIRSSWTQGRLKRLTSRDTSEQVTPPVDFVSVSDYPSPSVEIFRPGNVMNITTTVQREELGLGIGEGSQLSTRGSCDTDMRANDILVQQTFQINTGRPSRDWDPWTNTSEAGDDHV
ncbi:hypothetical protein BO94DRAFT_613772 [Aspergillus sclerotioniger CBS 115572]|uniref:Rhodopsin domain-containing protein n=1 Tax=Aspergillus sclerotioniger CBS 115572 TaxID=1450535 RepID=A0A317UY55_9EURO|nr:hypothetical protein BO94DRAFT_613772 [Aspergillus sclerotioniger CBS 115572]PWY66526.1 hypothetical protein BO94DRAFT_613772 [Aspergillus sclerotioniger CBS 115572]